MVDSSHEPPEAQLGEPRSRNVVVVTGAAPLSTGVVAALPKDRTVIAADGGLDYALEAGLEPQVLVGDLDSISPAGLDWARRHIKIDEHPSDKDQTDTELALRHAVSLHPDRLILLAGGGDRLDHTLAALGALGAEHLTSIPWLECWWADQYALILHGPARAGLGLAAGTRISLLALHGQVDGITLRNTRWELRDAGLAPMSGIGVSNEVITSPVLIEVTSGIATLFVEAPAHPVPFEPELPISTASPEHETGERNHHEEQTR